MLKEVQHKMDIATILKECPKGMKLDSTICTDLYFDFVDDLGKIHCFIQRKGYRTGISFYPNGTLNNDPQYKCVIFPEGKTTWEGFQRPFKDGDILVGRSNQPFIFKKLNNNDGCYSYCGIGCGGEFGLASTDWTFTDSLRFATEEEKKKLFDAIEANGYSWDSEFKVLEKVRIDPGDVVVSSAGNIVLVSNIDEDDVVHFLCRLNPFTKVFEVKEDIGVGKVDNCKFASNKQKQKLFDCLASSGYRYNPETNTLEELIESNEDTDDKIVMAGIYFDRENYADEVELHLNNYEIEVRDGKTYAVFRNQETKALSPKFKVGDWIKHRLTGEVYKVLFVHLDGRGGGVYDVAITNEIGKSIDIKEQGNYELVNMKKNYKVKDLITYLLDFNMEADVLVNASGVPEEFDISWSDGGDSSDSSVINSKKRADTVCFNVICGEK